MNTKLQSLFVVLALLAGVHQAISPIARHQLLQPERGIGLHQFATGQRGLGAMGFVFVRAVGPTGQGQQDWTR